MRTHSTGRVLDLLVVFFAILALGLPVAPAHAALEVAAPPETEPLPPGASPDWWATIREQIRQSEYDVTWQDSTYLPDVPAAYQAPNRAQGLRTYFTPEGVVVIPRTGVEEALPWRLGLRVATAGGGRLAADGNRIEYRYPSLPGLTEAYANDEAGLRQELTLASALPGGGPGVIDLSMSGDLVASLSADGTAVELAAADGAPVLRYTLLSVTGAQGQPLAARLELAGQSLRLVLDQGRPVYPLTVIARLESTAPDTEGTIGAPQGADAVAPEGLSTTANWTAESDQANSGFGISVGTAGDVNGDGYADVIVGAYAYDNGQTDEGAAFCYHGSAAGLSTTANWMAESDQDSALLGYLAFGTAGDVNGDGYADVVVGALYYDNGQTNEGAAFVWYGSAIGLGPNGNPANADWMVESDQGSAILGYAAHTAGDVNGDGYGDLIVGSHWYNNGEAYEGAALVYYGSATGLGPNGTPANADWLAESDQINSRLGYAVGTAGDVNGDGYADVIIGADSYDNGETDEGAAFVWYGSATGLGPNGNPANADWLADSDQTDAPLFGSAVGTAGDVNGDGYADVVVGAPQYDLGQQDEGRVFVYYGSAGGLLTTADWTAESDQELAYLGFSVGTAGDVNGDGYADVVVGAYSYDNGQADEGAAFVYHGSAAGLGDNGTPANADWMAESDHALARLGISAGTAGDVNGDGYADVIVGADMYSNGQMYEGAAFCYHGAPIGLSPVANWTSDGEQTYRGYQVDTAGDVNGDGYDDIMTSEILFDAGQEDEGRAYLFYGSADGPSLTPDWVVDGDIDYIYFGSSVGTAGDVNNDGYDDILVSARQYSGFEGNEGRVYLYYGSASGPSTTEDWTAESNGETAYFGTQASTAGDVNGDGYADIIVGAFGYDHNEGSEGAAFVWHGSADGMGPDGTPDNADWMAESNQAGAYLGSTVNQAGDVNGDGYGDVIVGSLYYSNGQSNEGAAFVWYGSATGLGPNGTPANADWMFETDQSAAYMSGVNTAGDVNGDGYADVIVGPYRYTNDQWYEGSAFLYYGSAAGLGPNGNPGNFDWKAESHQQEGYLGASVGTAGDVNGDGYADVLVSAHLYDNGQTDEGIVLAFYGSATGLGVMGTPANADWLVESDQYQGWMGDCVASAGDVNGDGYADVILGAHNANGGTGRAYVYYGNPSVPTGGGGGGGLVVTPMQWRADDSAPIAHLGMSAPNAFRLALLGRTPFGRGLVKLEWEIKELDTPFDGAGLEQSAAWLDTGTAGAALDELVEDLLPSTVYHWRVRLRYHPAVTPFQQVSRWITQPWEGWNEADLRIAPPAVQFSSGAYSVVEGAGSAPITVTLSTAPILTATVAYSAADGTAVAGSDYVTTSGTLTFTPGVTSQTFNVPIVDDEIDEPAETVSLTLSGSFQLLYGTPVTAVLTILDDNDAPVAADDAFTVTEDSLNNALAVLANDADPELSPLAVSAVGAPSQGGTVINAGTHITYTPAANFYGLETFTYTAADGQGGYDTAMVTVTVTAVNDPPVLAPIGAKSVNEGALLSFTATATDDDVPPGTLTFSLDAGAPAGASIDPVSGLFTWTPTEEQGPGVYPATIRVTAGGAPPLDDWETIQITVYEVNQAPVLAYIGDQTVPEGTLLSFTAAATDGDLPANVLAYSLDAGAPAGASIDPATGLFTWTPTEAQGPGVYPVTVRVTDNGTPPLDDSETIDIAVPEVNQPPVLAAIGAKSVDEGALLSFTATATDADLPANTLAYSLDAGAPTGASINPSTGLFTWTPTEAQGPGVYPVTVRVTDNGGPSLSDYETIQITVAEVNQAPVLAALGAKSVDEGALLSFTATATDADLPANTLAYSLDAGAPVGASINPSTGLFTWTPTEAQGPGVYPVTVRVTDNGTPPLSDYETIQITVAEINVPPVAVDDGYTTPEDTPLVVAAPGVLGNDSDGDLPPNPLAAVLDGGPVVGSLDLQGDGSFVYTPAPDYNGVVTFTYYVDDGLAVSPSAEVAITVTPVCDYAVQLDPPAVAQTGDAGTTVTYTLRLTNTGECVDVLEVTVDALWPTNAPATVGPLGAGEGIDVIVTVAIPAGAADGDQDVATVTLTSQGDGGVGATSVLTTTANVPIYRVYLPLVFRNH